MEFISKIEIGKVISEIKEEIEDLKENDYPYFKKVDSKTAVIDTLNWIISILES